MKSTKQYDVAALVRDSDKGAQIASQYPAIRLVYGDLDSSDVLEEEAKKADIILRAIFRSFDLVISTALTSTLYRLCKCRPRRCRRSLD